MKTSKLLLWIGSLFMIAQLCSASGGKKKEDDSQEQAIPEEEVQTEGVEAETPAPEPKEEKQKIETKKGVISGKVVDEIGNPVPGVDVSVIDESGKVIAQTTTNREGKYLFENFVRGKYTITVSYSGFTGPLEIKFDGEKKPPPPPDGLRIFEIGRDIHTYSYIHARWNHIPQIVSYKCELYLEGTDMPLLIYPEIKQNFCEFGNLEQDTAYEIRVYSLNDAGYSQTYAAKTITTENKAPLPPFGLGVTYAKNNRVDLIWHGSEDEDLKGYVLQIKKEKGNYLYYGKDGLFAQIQNAFLIERGNSEMESISISGSFENGDPLLENATAYSFRVRSIDQNGKASRPSTPVRGILLEDTVPPSPPYDIEYEFIDKSRLKLLWKSDDRDVEKFILYYGVNRDRWDGVVSTTQRSYELIIDRDKLSNKELLISIKAVDRSGNESGYKPYVRKIQLDRKEQITEDIVLSSNNIYKDYSVAIKTPPEEQKVTPQVKRTQPVRKKAAIPVQRRSYGYSTLKEKGFVVEQGETAMLKGRVEFPEDVDVHVKSGGTLKIDEAELAAEVETWGGIYFAPGSKGFLTNAKVAGAEIGISIEGNASGVKLQNVVIEGCRKAGLKIRNSSVAGTLLTVTNNTVGIYLENSRVSIANSAIERNERGILSNNYSLTVSESKIMHNRTYGMRLYGGGSVTGCYITHNLAGIVLEEGRGSVLLSRNRVEHNRMDGIVINTSHAEIDKNLISNNTRHGIYLKEGANPDIFENDIINNKYYGVIGGGKITRCFVAYNNGSAYVDDTPEKGRPDSVLSSSSSGIVKQILNVDYINELSLKSVLK
jgi:parallel beta-helix repeat protein